MAINGTMNASLLERILERLTETVVWVKPVFDPNGEVKDFEVVYANKAAEEAAMYPTGSLKGLCILKDGMPSTESAEINFKANLQVYHTGETNEYSFFAHHSGRQLEIVRRYFEGGVLSTMSDKRAQREAEKKEQSLRHTLNVLVENSPNGIAYYEACRDETGMINDFRIKYFNDKSNELTGITNKDREQMAFSKILARNNVSDLMEKYKLVVETGIPFQWELFIISLKKWLYASIVKIDDGFLATISDITEIKQSQQSLLDHKNLLDNILQNSSNGISVSKVFRNSDNIVIDAITIQANEAAINFIGLPKDIYLTKKASEIEPGIIGSSYYQSCIKTLDTGQPFMTQYKMESTGRWLELTVSRLDSDHLIQIFTDVTAIKETQIQLEEAADTLRAIFNAAQTGMFTLTPDYDKESKLIDFRFLMANSTILALSGIKTGRLEGESCSQLFPQYKDSSLFEFYKHTYETGLPQTREINYVEKGKESYLEIQCVKVGDHLFVSVIDHTTLRKSQVDLEKTIKALERSNRQLEDFAHAASHDLKEPLRKIRTFTDRIKASMGKRITEPESKLMTRIEFAAERMQLLVDDLLEFSHVSEGKRDLELIDLNEKIQKVLTDLELAIEEKHAKIHIESLPVIKGNRRQIQQLFQNLIGNALKYSKADVPPEINISYQKVKGSDAPILLPSGQRALIFHQIEVSDNGIGFEQEYGEKIFEMFQRLHGKMEYSGTGIGLSIARKVVENHNGYIWARSLPGNGATFFILLPVLEPK